MENVENAPNGASSALKRADSVSSQHSHTAQDFIKLQLQMEADAREALPYQFDTCTKPLGPLRQSVFACLTCTPPPASVHQQFTPAGVCYSCSISCHGEHNLVEIFTKRDFVCDCGTTRFTNSGTHCNLRLNAATGRKGDVKEEPAREGNEYNQNFKGTFCGCGQEYDPEIEKGTMFQCLGLGRLADGGCGEDWWHPECLLGIPRTKPARKERPSEPAGGLETVKEDGDTTVEGTLNGGEPPGPDDDAPLPEGFPAEEDFDHFICYKCVAAFPWIKSYAGTAGFLPGILAEPKRPLSDDESDPVDARSITGVVTTGTKRKADDEGLEELQDVKKVKSDDNEERKPQLRECEHDSEDMKPVDPAADKENADQSTAKHKTLPPAPQGKVSLFVKDDFRDYLCRCPECFPRLAKHPQLLEEEEIYEPPVSESGDENGSGGGGSRHSGSILDLGEQALSSVDRVRAIEGVMAYNHLRDKVKQFLQPFAESGQAVGAEDVKAYFAKLRGDDQAMRDAAVGASSGSGEADHRKEQGGY